VETPTWRHISYVTQYIQFYFPQRKPCSAHRTRQQSLNHHNEFPSFLRLIYCSLRQAKTTTCTCECNKVSLRDRKYFLILRHNNDQFLLLYLSICGHRSLTCSGDKRPVSVKRPFSMPQPCVVIQQATPTNPQGVM